MRQLVALPAASDMWSSPGSRSSELSKYSCTIWITRSSLRMASESDSSKGAPSLVTVMAVMSLGSTFLSTLTPTCGVVSAKSGATSAMVMR